MPINYPGSLDSLSNPTSTTKRNAPGFSLAAVIGLLNDIAEAVQAKLGISESSAQDTPLANTVLASSTNGKSKWRQVATDDIAVDSITLAGASAGSTSGPSMNSSSYATIQGDGTSSELRVTLVLAETGDIEASLVIAAQQGTAGNVMTIGLSLNGGTEVNEMQGTTWANNVALCLKTDKVWFDQPAGTYEIRGRYKVSGGSDWIGVSTRRYLNARAFYR